MADLTLQNTRKTPKYAAHEAAEGVRIAPGPFIGVVKSNTDPLRSGKLQVWIPELGGDPNDDKSWRTVSYSTPFYGVTPHRNSSDYQASPHSYGMWFVPPDIGVKVLCIFVNGDAARGYWFACVPEYPNLHMVPGISAPVNGSNPAPAVEYYSDQTNSSALQDAANLPKNAHQYQEQIWTRQGILQDPDRGPGTSSALRETPSYVFGISTPGKPIDPADPQVYNDPLNPSGESFGSAGRKGGHTFIMDDGDANDDNQMMRLRTSGGHMIMMNDTKDFIYIINSKGTAWCELTSQGDINIYGESTMNITAKAGFNLETDGAINMHAKKDISFKSDTNVNLEGKDINLKASGSAKLSGTNELHLKGKSTYLTGDGCIAVKSGGHIDLKGSCVTINTASPPAAKEAGSAQTPSQMPTHEPWNRSGTSGGGVSNPQAQPTYGSNYNMPGGAAGRYGIINNFGSGNTQQSYGPMTNDIGPIIYNSGPQGGFGGQNDPYSSYIPYGYDNSYGTQSYTTLAMLENLTYGSGAYFDINDYNSKDEPKSKYSVGELQNNPGNLEYNSKDKYAIGFSNNLAVYTRPENGIAALMTLFDSYEVNNPLTTLELLTAFKQAKVKDDNEVLQFARFVQNLIGIAPQDYVVLSDPKTRVGWASAVIQYIQGRIIYTYDQVVLGCATSLGVDPKVFGKQIQGKDKPWQNNYSNSTQNGFISPTSPSSSRGSSSLVDSVVGAVATNVVYNTVYKTVSNMFGSERQNATPQVEERNFVNGSTGVDTKTYAESGIYQSRTNPDRMLGDATGTASLALQQQNAKDIQNILQNGLPASVDSTVGITSSNNAYNYTSGSGASFGRQNVPVVIDTPLSSVGRQNVPVVIDTPLSSVGRQNVPVVIDTPDASVGRVNYKPPNYNDPRGNENNPYLAQYDTAPTRDLSYQKTQTGDGVNATPNNNNQYYDPTTGNYVNNNTGQNGVISNDVTGSQSAVSPDATNTSQTALNAQNSVRPEVDPNTGELVNQPITGNNPAPGSGGAAPSGGQMTPQGAAATGTGAGSC